ncbi:WhiB family transcriptional regulator [Streptomyces sp. NPDC001953]
MMRNSHDAPKTLQRPAWWGDKGVCREHDPDLFFPDDWRRGPGKLDAIAAKRVCGRCPVLEPCLHDALERGETHGVWGGLDPDERLQLKYPAQRDPAQDPGGGEEAGDASQLLQEAVSV